MGRLSFLGVFLLSAGLTGLRAEVQFSSDILPIFTAKCFDCHSTQNGAPKAGLRLDTREGIERGSKKNKIIVPKDPEQSLLFKLVSLPHDDIDLMPPAGKAEPLSGEQVLLVRKWIAEGANFGDWVAHDFSKPPSPTAVTERASVGRADGKMAWDRPSPMIPEDTVAGAARQIDQLVEANYRVNKIVPKPLADDATFLRRLYLDAAGRIPSYEETIAFLESDAPDKRARLVDQILSSEAYVSRQYNYWADVLRIQSRLRNVSGANYQRWLKDSIRDEKPYDQFVRELLTAEGHVYENGAAGYYIRDNGMPLDNMANTVQIFLGTRLACAQCHNHPFDRWTQKEFYQMAAFTYGVQTVRPGAKDDREKYREIAAMNLDNEVLQTARNMIRRTRFGFVSDNPGRALRLPDDYKYDDAAPKSKVTPTTLFTIADESHAITTRRDYADWLTSPDNPRFTVVIANRLWKQAMGLGVIEPHDDLKDDTVASNPDLMAYLADLMRKLDYNQKEFLRVIYNTQTYQREAVVREAASDEPYHFPGPVLRRMSAEQIWDSMMTLIVPDLDARTYVQENRYVDSLEEIERIHSMTSEELVRSAEAFVNRRRSKNRGSSEDEPMEMQMESRDPESPKTALDPRASRFVLTGSKKGGGDRKARRSLKTQEDASFPRTFVRASEIQQPAPAGHFLEEFGQSDREVIEGSNTSATVTQILNLMNGPAYAELDKARSVLSQALRRTSQTPSDMAETVFLCVYNAHPTEEELATAMEVLSADPRGGLRDLVWALLNTQRFMFIQ